MIRTVQLQCTANKRPFCRGKAVTLNKYRSICDASQTTQGIIGHLMGSRNNVKPRYSVRHNSSRVRPITIIMSTKAVRMLLPLKTKKVTNIATFTAFKSSCQIFPAITTNLAIFTTELGRSTSFVAYFPHSVSPFSRPFHTTSVANITKQIGGKQKVFPLCCKFVDHAMVFATVCKNCCIFYHPNHP